MARRSDERFPRFVEKHVMSTGPAGCECIGVSGINFRFPQP